jgi:hypothetical protein
VDGMVAGVEARVSLKLVWKTFLVGPLMLMPTLLAASAEPRPSVPAATAATTSTATAARFPPPRAP